MEKELSQQSNMVMMIFKFFLQSKEYTFFVRRLKNVAMTRTSFAQPSDFGSQQRPFNHTAVRGNDMPKFGQQQSFNQSDLRDSQRLSSTHAKFEHRWSQEPKQEAQF